MVKICRQSITRHNIVKSRLSFSLNQAQSGWLYNCQSPHRHNFVPRIREKFGGQKAFSGKIRGYWSFFGKNSGEFRAFWGGKLEEFKTFSRGNLGIQGFFFRKKICGIRVYLGTFLVFGKIWAHIHSKGIGFQHCSVSSKAVGQEDPLLMVTSFLECQDLHFRSDYL